MIDHTRITTPTLASGKITSMRTILEEHVRPHETIEIGTRGGRYVLRNDIRHYIIKERKRTRRSFKPRSGAYQRFVESQIAV